MSSVDTKSKTSAFPIKLLCLDGEGVLFFAGSSATPAQLVRQSAGRITLEAASRLVEERHCLPNLDIYALLEAVRARGISVALTTNLHSVSGDMLQDLGLADLIDHVLTAGSLGYHKPAAEYFRAVEVETGFAHETIAFTDDNRANVEAALRFGWKAHHYMGVSQLQQWINSL
jgi:HAD superfamily hydrolase (TIGR01509 family)